MSIRYYPISKIKPNLIANSGEFLLNGKPYSGLYYETFDGKYFSGPNPILGKNQPLTKSSLTKNGVEITNASNPKGDVIGVETVSVNTIAKAKSTSDRPVSYFPYPVDQDYTKGYIYRYFIKKINQSGFVVEISPTEYDQFQNGEVNYDVSMYLTAQIQWKLTGPLNTKRLSQYDIRAGIVDTNKRLTENLDKTFLGIKAFIGEDYTRWSRPTQ